MSPLPASFFLTFATKYGLFFLFYRHETFWCINWFHTLFTSTLKLMYVYHNNALTALIVWYLALRATMINWTDSCSDSPEPPGSLHLIAFTIYCKIWMGLFSLYALFLALWCWCLYIYTVWLVYCAIVLHVWNKLEWAWRTWKWAHHLYFIRHRQYYIKKLWLQRYTMPVKYHLIHLLRVKITTGYKQQYIHFKMEMFDHNSENK